MIENHKDRIKTDEAWKRVYARLDRDNLLAETTAGSSRSRYYRMMAGWGAVAAVLTGLVYLSVTWWFVPENKISEKSLITQENREKSTLVTTLEDGSIVYLAQASTLKYPEHFAGDKREVNLQGEAFFDVAKKHQQAFLIETEKVQIEVLGTAFNVRSSDKIPFCLSVKRGKVKVSLKQNGQSVYVNAGEMVTLQAHRLHLTENADIDFFNRYMSTIRFKDECLDNILRVVNKETPSLQIQTDSPVLGQRRLTVEFSERSPETVAELICLALKLKCMHQGNKLVLSE
ncbi:MAG: FecR domain-containing protein [Bacteroides sp.]|jgi:ferric-dicitrate binding protein FerR (iron transport regulator)|nr:FecR domain-containing protein [Bacteroides sp.]MCI1682942.1 FecR domain-containing protein [Bacteroides sp.]